MGKALFLGLSAVFFGAYAAIANALLVPITPISSINNQGSGNPDQQVCEGFPPDSLDQFLICSGWGDLPIVGPVLSGINDIFVAAAQLFGVFFQLVFFQAGLPAASMVTVLIFVPLGLANGFIVYSAIRGGD